VTGARITVSDADLAAALAELARVGRDPAPALRPIGSILVRNIRNRIVAEETPDGAPFASLQERTRQRKSGAGILRERAMRGGLFGSFVSQVDGAVLRVGTNKVYAATHQFGRDAIPARPFLGLSDEDRRDIRETIQGHMRRVTGA
jgi:phage virion morphogenesis protein